MQICFIALGWVFFDSPRVTARRRSKTDRRSLSDAWTSYVLHSVGQREIGPLSKQEVTWSWSLKEKQNTGFNTHKTAFDQAEQFRSRGIFQMETGEKSFRVNESHFTHLLRKTPEIRTHPAAVRAVEEAARKCTLPNRKSQIERPQVDTGRRRPSNDFPGALRK
jgi:hypothetical protein